MDRPQGKEDWPPRVTFKLVLAGKAKAFPWAALATYLLVNDSPSAKTHLIDFAKENAALFDPQNNMSNVKLIHREGKQYIGPIEACLQLVCDFKPTANLSPDIDRHTSKFILALEKCYEPEQTTWQKGLDYFDKILMFSMHPMGFHESVGDVLVWGAIRGNPEALTEVIGGKFPHVKGWYEECALKLVCVHQAEAWFKKDSKPKAKPKDIGFKLDGAEMGKVVTRFPPEPSGYLHIGHAKAAILNATAARDYEGQLILRFDDTNPSKEREEYQDSILEDLNTLGVKAQVLSCTSDYLDQIEEKCIELINLGKAYCDDTPVEEMRKERMEGIASKCRERLPQDSIRIFNEMRQFTPDGQKHCVRAKISSDNKNKALRDPVIYRCNDTPHHRTGTKYKVYPTYDFACPIVDSIEGVTHALRTLEYKDRDAQYAWMLKALGMRPVKVIGFSRLNFVRTVLSKRKLQWFVDQGLVSGWDDPRFPTVRGVMRRGCVIEALRKFIISQGPSRNINNLEWASFWAENKKVIDPISKRFTCVTAKHVVRLHLVDGEGIPVEPLARDVPCHKKNPSLGKKAVWFSNRLLIEQDDAHQMKKGEEITLMDWGNAIITDIKTKPIPESPTPIVTEMEATLNLMGDFKKTEKKIHWVADVAKSLTPCTLTTFDHLITKDKLEDGDNVADFVNPDTVSYLEVIGDINLQSMPTGEIIQFERKGYYRLDRPYDSETGQGGEFFLIPDGKTVNKYGTKKE